MWRAALDPPVHEVAALTALLSADEHARAARLRARERRRRFVVARGVVRTVLARYLGTDPASLRFEYGPRGKPRLAATSLRFNLSHSHDLAVLAVTHGRELGIDVERIRDTVAVTPLATRFFSPAECAALEALPVDERRPGFFRLWTRKEAYLKATGEGVSRELRAIDVTGPPDQWAPVRVGDVTDARFRVRDLGPGPAYVTALAMEGDDARVCAWQWAFSQSPAG